MIRACDTDGSGSVEFGEFMDMLSDQLEVRKRIEKKFDDNDSDVWGRIEQV